MQIRGIPMFYGAPNANAICERVIGTLRRECMNHFIFVSEQHLRETLAEYRVYYNKARLHQGIEGIPGELNEPRAPPEDGKTRLVGKAVLGGLDHDCRLAA
ncbi:MAG: putative transposase [Cognaticolwellia sp.]|jgi:putative transposase